MHITTLRLHNFRNHLDSSFDFGSNTNLFLGDNGHGKTNIIEAISYLCLAKSFYAAQDGLCLNFHHDLFEVEGTFVSESGVSHRVRVAYAMPQAEKIVTINGHPLEPFSQIVGKFPVVICSPDHAPITSGGPSERRRFVDFVISQSSATYFQDFIAYRKVLRHRNAVLTDARALRKDASAMLQPWNEQLVSLGSRLMFKRKQFVGEFQEFITSAYHHLTDGREEEPGIEYQALAGDFPSTAPEIEEMLRRSLQERESDERRLGTTLVGPHRDEFVLRINGLELRKYASQGQHKTFLIALKLGEFFYLKDRCAERPLLLLDDVFSELDQHRSESLLKFVGELSQTFITSTIPQFFEEAIPFGNENRKFFIEAGTIVGHNQGVAA